ncbi:FAD-dependent oxidoreductase [Algoriphagus sp. H41]|uniref:FAD-dependent oxidoreductase n=1 Tax=Algoriphagus oliviformis TaxID=2811231 RepID=A0ABS3C8Q9_9BACT|nr:FAD-dependent oxidoreductase [Algoriphagus oliviformis]MBN7813362.1 FAD-dependent oxidoreductase [Algoriphagus oliviformis]
MKSLSSPNQTCVVIGASHAGVSFAFALRKEGWQGGIVLIDQDPDLPYHRPPLSKSYLANPGNGLSLLKAQESYEKEQIQLKLGIKVTTLDRESKALRLSDGNVLSYDKLVFATGARAWMPQLNGMEPGMPLFTLRNAGDMRRIQQRVGQSTSKRALIVGGGFIGLELAASFRKMGLAVAVMEREERVLSRVTAPELSSYFEKLHRSQGVEVLLGQEVKAIRPSKNGLQVSIMDNLSIEADLLVFGVGIRVNSELAEQTGLDATGGIAVDGQCRTADKHIYAIGDCTLHYNPYYERHLRLESVQNAVDQAKTAAAALMGKPEVYDALPWFWSDQYDLKLQMVGLSQGYDHSVLRREGEHSFSLWYFKEGRLLAVDAVNVPKAYVWGTKYLKERTALDSEKVGDPTIDYSSFAFSPTPHLNLPK